MITKFKTTQYSNPTFQKVGKNLTEKAGEMIAEAFNKEGKSAVLKENFGITFKEDATTTTNAGAYTTMLSSTLYTAALEEIAPVMELIIPNRDLVNQGGFGAYQIPRLEPTVALEIAEGAVINYFDEGIDAVTVTPRKVVAGTAITWEILKRGMTDFAKFVLANAADAVARKMASDIVNGLAAGAGNTAAGGVSYAAISLGIKTVKGAKTSNDVKYGFIPNRLVLNEDSEEDFYNDSDVKSRLHFPTLQGNEVVVSAPVQRFRGMEIVVSPFLTSAEALVMDNRKAAMLVIESELETFEGRIPGRLFDIEVIAMQSYVLAVIYSSAIYSITA